MTRKSARWHLLLWLVMGAAGLCLGVDSALAQGERFTVDPATEVPLKLGWNAVDLQFDGTKYHILGQHNDIGTVHNTMTYTFVDPDFNSVFFEPGAFPEDLSFPQVHARSTSTAQGADYQLTSVRLLLDPKARTAHVVVAQREYGNSFVDSRPVTIELFKFRTLSEAHRDGGAAASAFVLDRYFATQKCYPDSNYALVNELGFPPGPYDDQPAKTDRSKPCSKS